MNLKRRRILAFLTSGTLLFALLSVAVLGSPPSTMDFEDIDSLSEGPWPSFGMDERNTRLSPYSSGHVDGNLDWTYGTGFWLWSSPAIGSEGVMYFGSPNDDLYALDVEDGSEKWVFSTDGDILSSPAVSHEEVIYFGSGDHNIYALNPNGSLKWSYTTDGEVYSSPTVDLEGNVYVGSYDGNLYSISGEGELNWRFSSDSWLWSSPALGRDGAVYVGSGDNNLYAIDMVSGEELWNHTTEGSIYSSPAVDEDGCIYFGSYDGYLYALNPDGGVEWEIDLGARIHTSPAVGEDGTIYVGADDGGFYAVHDGELQWSYQTGDRIRSSAALSGDGVIYFGSYDSHFYALDTDGEERWIHEIGSTVYSSPAINEDGRVFVCAWNGDVYAFTGMEHVDEVTVSLAVTGRKGNIVDAVITENGEDIDSVSVKRTPGPPNEGEICFEYDNEKEHSLILQYDGKYLGANPVNITLNTGTGFVRLFYNFVGVNGRFQEVSFDLNEEIEDMLSKTKEMPSFGRGGEGYPLDPTLSISFYQPEAETMDVVFYDGSDGSEIGSVHGSPMGEVAQVTWEGLEENSDHTWYAEVTIEGEEIELGPWEFSTAGIDDVFITDDGDIITERRVYTNSQVEGYLSAYNETHGFIGQVPGDWSAAGGNSELTQDGLYRRSCGIDVGDISGEVWFNATYDVFSHSVIYTVLTPLSDGLHSIPQEMELNNGSGALDLSSYIPDADNRRLTISVDDPRVEVVDHTLVFNHEEPGTHNVTVEVEDEISSSSFDLRLHVPSSYQATTPTSSGSMDPLWILAVIPIGLAGVLVYKFKKDKFKVEDIFLIHESGVLIEHTASSLNSYVEEDILAGMFMAINNFVQDAFGGHEKHTLKSMRYGDKTVLVHRGENVILAVFLSGEPPAWFSDNMRVVVEDIEMRYALKEWDGNRRNLPGIGEILKQLHEQQGRFTHRTWK